jgi:hypothetical protein
MIHYISSKNLKIFYCNICNDTSVYYILLMILVLDEKSSLLFIDRSISNKEFVISIEILSQLRFIFYAQLVEFILTHPLSFLLKHYMYIMFF